MSAIYTRTLADLSWEEVTAGASSLLARYRGAIEEERVVVLPDMHYPFHPSTGLTTNPLLVEAIVSRLATIDDVEVALGRQSASVIDTERTAHFLGYDALVDRYGIDAVDLDGADRTQRTVRVGDERVEAGVPEPLAESLVLNVPTLRTSKEHALAAAMVNIGRTLTEEEALTAELIWAATGLYTTVTILDGTYTYAGEPRRSRMLVSGEGATAIDAAVVEMLGRDASTVPYVSDGMVRAERRSRTVEGPPLSDLAETLPEGGESKREFGGNAMGLGYRLYARVTGDGVPPQFMGGGG